MGKGGRKIFSVSFSESNSSESAGNISPTKENILKKVKRLSLECKNQDIIGVIMPRLCGVIQSFYIVCSCQSPPQ